MNTKHIWKILDRDRRLNFNSKAEFARKIGLSPQGLTDFMNVLKSCKEKNSFNKICFVLEKLGIRRVLLNKNGDEINLD